MSTTITEVRAVSSAAPKITELRPGFGAEIKGLDFGEGVTEEAFRFVENAVIKVAWFEAFPVPRPKLRNLKANAHVVVRCCGHPRYSFERRHSCRASPQIR